MIIDLNLSSWKNVNENGSSNYQYFVKKIGLTMKKSGWNIFRWKNTRKSKYCDFCCVICKKRIYGKYIGDSYNKICCDCGSNWVEKSKEELYNIISRLDLAKHELDNNRKKWDILSKKNKIRSEKQDLLNAMGGKNS